ncbi:MAG TPA: IclR family transcriptional regulator [Solirubrobacteraceae bacterium]|nr:IclR family transcriptional regulator [Solirubrobacteraceae bacterium]
MHLPTSQEGRYSQSLERGLAILRTFTPERPWLGIAEIAQQLEMSRPTTHRYASTLVALNYLEQGRGRKYRLGMRAADPGRAAVASTVVRNIAPQLLRQLRDNSGYTASMAVLDGSHVVYVDRARSVRQGRSEVAARLGRGSRLPAATTALGKALLAELDDDARHQALAEAELTAAEIDKLVEELGRVRKHAVAVSDQLRIAGQICVAAAVRSKSGQAVAAVDVAVAKADCAATHAREHVGPLVRAAAEQMSAKLGYSPRS